MAVSRDTTDMLYKATVAYSQLYLLYKSAEWSGGGSGQFSSEIDSSLKRLYCSLKGPQTTCCSSVPEVVSEVLDLLPSTSSPLSAVDLESLKWIILLSLSCGIDGNVTDGKDILCLSAKAQPHSLELALVLKSVKELVHMMQNIKEETNDELKVESSAMDTSAQQPCHKKATFIQAYSLAKQQEYSPALEAIYQELKGPHCNVDCCHMFAGWCHFMNKRYNLALLHFRKCLTGVAPLSLVLMCMAFCYRRLHLDSCELETWMLLAQSLRASESEKPKLPKVYIWIKQGSLAISRTVPFASSPSLHEVELMISQRSISVGRFSEASTRLLQVIRDSPQQLLTLRTLHCIPALFLTAARSLVMQKSIYEAEKLCNEVLSIYDGGQQCEGNNGSIDVSVKAEALYLKGYCLLARKQPSEAITPLNRCMECVSMAQAQLKDKDVRDHSEHLKTMAANSLSMALVKMHRYEEAQLQLTAAVSEADNG
jgi:tetratricopeptide (TPR) repeat protein